MKTVKYINHLHPDLWPVVDAALDTACIRAGCASALAKHLNISRNTISLWKTHARLPTPEQAVFIEMAVRVSRKSVRPDIDWRYVDETTFRNLPAQIVADNVLEV